jgi:hypothetical protein
MGGKRTLDLHRTSATPATLQRRHSWFSTVCPCTTASGLSREFWPTPWGYYPLCSPAVRSPVGGRKAKRAIKAAVVMAQLSVCRDLFPRELHPICRTIVQYGCLFQAKPLAGAGGAEKAEAHSARSASFMM